MATTTYLDVKYRLGDIEANIGTGSDAIISNAISGAYDEVIALTGSSTDNLVQFAVANFAASTIARSFLGRDDVTVSNQRVELASQLREIGEKQIRAIGHRTRYSKSNA